MKENNFTPEQSLQLISSVINEAKVKFEENGAVYMMWGLLVAMAAFAQYFLLTNNYESISYYPWFLMPIGGIVSGIYYSKKGGGKQKGSHLSKVISSLWLCVSINVLLLGFAFAAVLQESLSPMILILISIGITISGFILRIPILIGAGILMNVIGVASFFVDYLHQPLLLGFANLLCVFLPGLIIMRRYNKSHV